MLDSLVLADRFCASQLFAEPHVASLPVLYEDNHLLVVNKPAGLATMGAVAGSTTVATLAASYLKRRYQKPGNAFVGVVSRLDRLVSGVLVLARTSKAASRLSEQFRNQTTEKSYLAWVEGDFNASDWIELQDSVIKDEAQQRMRISTATSAGSQLAKLRVRAVKQERDRTHVAVQLLTGRKHQIRLQLAHAGHPILGDQKYGASTRFARGIALHCQRVTVDHPTRKEPLTFVAPVPEYWPRA